MSKRTKNKPGRRWCRQCEKEHPLTERYFSKRHGGFQWKCKSCHSKYFKQWKTRKKVRKLDTEPTHPLAIPGVKIVHSESFSHCFSGHEERMKMHENRIAMLKEAGKI
jgi:hypothetical protein